MSFRTNRRVEFRDTDAAGIVHFSAFFPWMESAEHEMLRSMGIKIIPDSHDAADEVTWPRVSVSCDYHQAARFEDWLTVDVTVGKVGRSSVQYEIAFFRESDAGEMLPIATGKIVVVCCKLQSGGRLQKAEIPADIRAKLESI
ncbi:acyl-CoA thioesterase [Rhodopirellula sp. MGV]|uniref:acyl-CoA thioesterase n=1 Tax=Rhodopirellula sp. MGV TaxID=2023130 RepID=UPI000B97C117|nr:thioesterase family protein [Rhodopirellula sp. MGV]OYP33959.1 thioesterase [Rhodopirellula sp. MGV]PNY33532.1 acyl-CoA thioesterase [Rhodopirellula baltica]